MPRDQAIEKQRVLTAKRQRLLKESLTRIEKSIRILEVIGVIEVGNIYEFPNKSVAVRPAPITCGIIDDMGEDRFSMWALASNEIEYVGSGKHCCSYSDFSPKDFRLIKKGDLLLYVGWKFVSPDLHRLIAGTFK